MKNSTEKENTEKRFQLTYGQYAYFKEMVWPKVKEHQRWGQAFYNEFSEWQTKPQEPFPELFYEKDDDKAMIIIEENTEFTEE